MIHMTREECWLVGNRLQGLNTGEVVSVDISPITDDGSKGRLDSIYGRPDDLHVLHVEFSGNVGILEFLNQVVAQRFDLPDRHVRVKFSKHVGNLLQGEGKAVDAAGGVLVPTEPVHFVIPRSVWIEYRAKHAAEMIRREEWWRARPVSPNPEEAA